MPIKKQRYPRPLGTTYAAIQYTQEPDTYKKQRFKERLQENTIEQYISSGFKLNNKTYTIAELATYLDMKPERILLGLNRTIIRMNKMMKGEDGMALARVCFFQAIQNALEGTSLARHQAQILATAQGDNYVPFLTKELNTAIANLSSSTKPLMELLKLNLDSKLTGGADTQQGNDFHTKYLSPDDALKLINTELTSIQNSDQKLEQKLLEIGTEIELPEVRASYQNNTDIGIPIVAKIMPESVPKSTDKTSPEHHQNRRQQQLHIADDLEAEDFTA